MIHTDPAFGERVEAAVASIELHTDVEVIVVAAPRSGGYRDLTLLAASGGALCTLILLLALPWGLHPALGVLDLVGVYALSAWFFSADPLLRLLLPSARAKRQVEDAARVEFHREAVHATPNRTGLLVYISGLERRVELLPDLVLEGKVPPGAWVEARARFATHALDDFIAGLELLGEVLAQHVPVVDGSHDFNLPDAPRVRP